MSAPKPEVKICGLATPDAVDAAVAGEARFVGFVFYPPSPRNLAPMVAMQLSRRLPTGVRAVALFVDPGDAELDRVLHQVPIDMIQLHGEEDPARVAAIRARTGQPVIKAIRVADAADLVAAGAYADVADYLLFDARLPKNVATLPGGNGLAFDWTILAGFASPRPWFLSGGLNDTNVGEAMAATGARLLDVSSGVESRPGVKDPTRIRAFLDAAHGR